MQRNLGNEQDLNGPVASDEPWFDRNPCKRARPQRRADHMTSNEMVVVLS
jgi:hypothetical protein